MIRAIIVDDEQLALRHLHKKLLETKIVDVVGTYSNAADVLKEMKTVQFDVAFLDIEMPGLSGLDLADLINEWNKEINIVFVTAYRDYAVQAFELHSIDYLLKPIILERLEKTTLRIRDQIKMRTKKVVHREGLKIICLKEFNVYHQGAPVKWKTGKVKELFAYLFTHLHEHIQRDTLIETLWPEVAYQRAKIQLHTSVSYLRKMLDDMGYPEAITFSNGNYAMSIDNFLCDVYQFERVIEEHALPTIENSSVFEEIVQQYSGDYMESTGYEWALPKAHAVRQKLLHILQMMVDYYTQTDILNKKQEYLQLLVSFTPYSEDATQQLMQFFVDIGNRGEAIQVYHKLKKLLIAELGILPDQSTTELYNSILEGTKVPGR